MKLSRSAFPLFLLATVLTTACKRDMFDADAYNKIISEVSSFSDIDPNHNWNLTASHSTIVTANIAESVELNRVCILRGNPYSDAEAEILAESACTKGQTVTLFYYAPTCLKDLYAALVTTDGKWLLKSFPVGQQALDFSSDVLTFEGTPSATYQTYTYCFEEDYPQPGDNDYNDLVLRVQKIPAQGDNEIRLRITLAALGTLNQVAAAIRLTGYDYDDVESVTTEEGRVFDPNYPMKRMFVTKSALLLKGLHGEAVLNLFDDAHYAFNPTVNTASNGSRGPARRYYNTSQVADGIISMQAAPKSLTYIIKLRNPHLLQNFTLEDIDPFIMKEFNGGKWEVHTFAFKASSVLHDLGSNETATSNIMSWALKVPYGNFRYPQEKINIGYYKDGILTGAYMTLDHSFGQWIANRNNSLDWFLFPSTGMVY